MRWINKVIAVLKYDSFFFQGLPGLAAKCMFELMTEGPPIVALIGPTFSIELTVTGQIAPFYSVTKVKWGFSDIDVALTICESWALFFVSTW